MLSLILAVFCLAGILPDAPQESSWKQVSSTDGRFTVSMPDEPRTNTIVTETREGRLVTHTTSTTDQNLNEYQVSWTEYPHHESIEQRARSRTLERVRDALAISNDARVFQDSSITSEGHPARAFSMKKADGRILSVRIYFVKNRFYQVMADTKPGYTDDGERFLNSFKLLPGNLI
jgi:hypothetical protein